MALKALYCSNCGSKFGVGNQRHSTMVDGKRVPDGVCMPCYKASEVKAAPKPKVSKPKTAGTAKPKTAKPKTPKAPKAKSETPKRSPSPKKSASGSATPKRTRKPKTE